MLLLDVGKKRNEQLSSFIVMQTVRVGDLIVMRILGCWYRNPGLWCGILCNIFIGVIIHLGMFFCNVMKILLYLHALNLNLYAISSLTWVLFVQLLFHTFCETVNELYLSYWIDMSFTCMHFWCEFMYFPLVFEVIRRTCFALTPATPFIVPSTLLLVGF